jgi:hypothetical protein
MNWRHPSRLGLGAVLLVLLATTPAFARFRQPRNGPPQSNQNRPAARAQVQARPPQNVPAPQVRPAPNVQQPGLQQPGAQDREEHLQRWMDTRKNLSLPELQRDLQNEPGFRDLPPQMQQNRLNMLKRLYNMSPDQRQKMLNGVEGLERLSPQQQQQWRGAVQQLNALPIPQRRFAARAIADLSQMPPNQREQRMNSPEFQSQFTPDERQMIRTLLTANPSFGPAGTP